VLQGSRCQPHYCPASRFRRARWTSRNVMTVARTNNGSRMKTNNLVPSRTVPKPGRRGPFRRRLHQALRLSHPRQFSVRPCVTAHPWISTSWSAPLIAHPGPPFQLQSARISTWLASGARVNTRNLKRETVSMKAVRPLRIFAKGRTTYVASKLKINASSYAPMTIQQLPTLRFTN
jgi:hypothetical protein